MSVLTGPWGQINQQNAAQQHQNYQAMTFTPAFAPYPSWDLLVRKIANGYLIECGNKQYQCPDLEHLGEVITAALVEKRVTG